MKTSFLPQKSRKRKILISGILLLSLGTVFQLFAADNRGYLSVTGPCNLEFPKDHGSHSGYRTEWWYYTGNVSSENGSRFGFQLTFFRSQLSPSGESRYWPKPSSQWRTQQVYLAHAAISDLAGGRHLHAEDISRGALGLAGVSLNETGITTVHLKNWYAKIGSENQHLKAATDRFAFNLELIPSKKPILHGQAGYSRKGRVSESASCYYSFTRLKTRGSLTLDGKTFAVEGLSWMDHEFSTAPLEPEIVGWDWFSLVLSDRTELMVYLLRQKDGSINSASSGTFVDPAGDSRHLVKEEFRVQVLDTWKSPNSGALYPVRWRLSVLPLSMELSIVSNLADQELQTTNSTGVTYWEGSVSITGTKNDRRIEGQGYVELTGYAKPFDAPM